jgi:pullulanase/glycogen debranching enzyme
VVFNHTAEGNEHGPTLCFRGLANDLYYILEPDRSRYAKYTGTGNTLNGNNSIVRRMIVDSLRYWVGEMHVDGFRFDLASILARDAAGHVMPNPPVLWDIESDPLPAGTKLIAEAWDAAGLYQVGSFVGDSWREWNGRFRDDARDSPQPSLALRRFPRKSTGRPARLHCGDYGIFNWRSVHFDRTLFLLRRTGSIFLPLLAGETGSLLPR